MKESIIRFIELSKEFTIEEFTPKQSNVMFISNTSVGFGVGKLQEERMLKEKREKAKRYEEYLELQRKLEEHFNEKD